MFYDFMFEKYFRLGNFYYPDVEKKYYKENYFQSGGREIILTA